MIEHATSIEFLFQDEWMFAVNKPAGLLVHRGLGRDAVTLVDLVRNHMDQTVVYPAHRIDRQTSGVVLFARTALVAAELQKLFSDCLATKTYLALVRGVPPPVGEVDSPVPCREDGPRVAACTRFETLKSAKTEPRTVSLVRAFPITGRFHQVRRHLKHAGHPIIGDANYGRGDLNRAFREQFCLERMALHAESLVFVHPHTGQIIRLTAPLPPDLKTPLSAMGLHIV